MDKHRATDLQRAYKQAIYVVFKDAGELTLRIGVRSAQLDGLLQQSAVVKAAFLTACNPGSKRLSVAENSHRQQQLLAAVQAGGYSFLLGEGRDPAGDWPAEQSFLVLGIQPTKAAELALEFGQNAYVSLLEGKPPQLVFSSDG